MVEFTPSTPPIRNKKGKELYNGQIKPFPVRIWKRNREKVPYLVNRFKLRTRNELINHLIQLGELLYDLEGELKEKGELKLSREVREKYGIKV